MALGGRTLVHAHSVNWVGSLLQEPWPTDPPTYYTALTEVHSGPATYYRVTHLAKEGNKRWCVFWRGVEAAAALSTSLSLAHPLLSLWSSVFG